MNLTRALTTFVAVCDNSGFAAAGRSLNRSKALVSKQISGLEDHLGARAQRHRGLADVDQLGDLRVHHETFMRLAPMTSSRARPMAVSTRRKRSSERSWVIKMPGLNWRTRGSRVEKIAQTPFS